MDKVRAKFKCDSVKSFVGGKEVVFSPVTTGSEENKEFWQYTPAGELKMQISNLPAAEMFVPGEEYYLDFTSA